ncbi:MAG: GtrA family protein [Actinomycetia bacterium]|nr:GtrA family protein [Actinomycetes bacterium]
MPARPSLLDRVRTRLGVLYRELLKFGVVGAIAFVIDLGGTNLLWHTVLEDKVTTAKIIAGAAATLFAWVGNRAWTFRRRRNRPAIQEVVLFFAVNGIALLIAAGVLALSHYGLGFQTRLADNVATIIGIGIGTIFRFIAYRYVVFSGATPPDDAAADIVSAHLEGSHPHRHDG